MRWIKAKVTISAWRANNRVFIPFRVKDSSLNVVIVFHHVEVLGKWNASSENGTYQIVYPVEQAKLAKWHGQWRSLWELHNARITLQWQLHCMPWADRMPSEEERECERTKSTFSSSAATGPRFTEARMDPASPVLAWILRQKYQSTHQFWSTLYGVTSKGLRMTANLFRLSIYWGIVSQVMVLGLQSAPPLCIRIVPMGFCHCFPGAGAIARR